LAFLKEEVEPPNTIWPWKDLNIFLKKLPKAKQQFYFAGRYEVPNQKNIYIYALLRKKSFKCCLL
jgi:hypothetical protein